MIREVHHALSRALAFCCGEGAFEIEKLFHRMTWELHHATLQDFAALALVVRKGDGSLFVGRSRDHQALPAETLLGLLVEHDGAKLSCRVKDHALDTVRFIDARFRTSVLVRVELPHEIVATRDAALWFGLVGGASPEAVAEAESMGRELSEWFAWYGDVIVSSMRVVTEKATMQSRIADMTSVLHDARAPLAVVRYLLKSHGFVRQDETIIENELLYLERLLAAGAPLQKAVEEQSCDVREVVRRVVTRFKREGAALVHMDYDEGYDDIFAQIPDLALERIATNILGNAARYGDRVVVSIRSDGQMVEVSIRDNGSGFSKPALEAFLRGDAVVDVSETSGWGIGLSTSRLALEKVGGRLLISSHDGAGTLVRVQLKPASGISRGSFTGQVGEAVCDESRYSERSLAFIVDDDGEQAESLARVLRQYGVRSQVFASLEPMLRELEVVKPRFVLCDGHMPGGGAERLLALFRGREEYPIVGVMSGEASEDQQYRLAALGARAFFMKPIVIEDVLVWAESLPMVGMDTAA